MALQRLINILVSCPAPALWTRLNISTNTVKQLPLLKGFTVVSDFQTDILFINLQEHLNHIFWALKEKLQKQDQIIWNLKPVDKRAGLGRAVPTLAK